LVRQTRLGPDNCTDDGWLKMIPKKTLYMRDDESETVADDLFDLIEQVANFRACLMFVFAEGLFARVDGQREGHAYLLRDACCWLARSAYSFFSV
jgi:hypothetical protein